MCPACSRSPDGLLALMESANRGLITQAGESPNEAAGFSRLRRIDRLCHHASLLSRKLQHWRYELLSLLHDRNSVPVLVEGKGGASQRQRSSPVMV
jgi:hypothetical protein